MATAPTRRRLSKDARRAELLRAGEDVFSERPFEEVSIDDIAAAAGISKNLLYHYFAGKRELYLAVISDSTERMLDATEPDLSLEPLERLHASLGAHLDYAQAHQKGYIALVRGSGTDEDVLAIVRAAHDRVVERTLATLPFEGRPPKEMEMALRGWLGMVDYLTLFWLEQRTLSKARVRELMAELFISVVIAASNVAARPKP